MMLKGAPVRWLFKLHAWLGMAVGLLMAMWCVSGIVMMYVAYPSLLPEERVAGLAPIDWSECCAIGEIGLPDDVGVEAADIEMLAGHPVLRLTPSVGPQSLIDLTNGQEIEEITQSIAQAVARDFAKGVSISPGVLVDIDQWTVGDAGAGRGPFYRFDFGDAAKTELYVSTVTGRAIQITTASQRFWNWLGAIPHWLYFTELRQNAALWTNVIVWTSLIGSLLAALGLYIGIRQFSRARRAKRWSPYKGFAWWHHVPGFIFGIFTFSWVLSGLFSMNPWGWFETASARPERGLIQGTPPSIAELGAVFSVMAASPNTQGAVLVSAVPLDGKIFMLATRADGSRVRLNSNGDAAPFSLTDVKQIMARLSGGEPATAQYLTKEDSYYFSHHREIVRLPAYRIVLNDMGDTRYYIDPVSGALLSKVDSGGKEYRWFHEGLHRLDFTPALRSRPLWDVVMLVLMAGVTMVCATGAYLSVRRIIGRPVIWRRPVTTPRKPT